MQGDAAALRDRDGAAAVPDLRDGGRGSGVKERVPPLALVPLARAPVTFVPPNLSLDGNSGQDSG